MRRRRGCRTRRGRFEPVEEGEALDETEEGAELIDVDEETDG